MHQSPSNPGVYEKKHGARLVLLPKGCLKKSQNKMFTRKILLYLQKGWSQEVYRGDILCGIDTLLVIDSIAQVL